MLLNHYPILSTVGLNLNFEFESAHELLMNLNLNSTFVKSMNLNLNLVFSKPKNLNLKIKNKMNGSNQCCRYEREGRIRGRTPLAAACAPILVD